MQNSKEYIWKIWKEKTIPLLLKSVPSVRHNFSSVMVIQQKAWSSSQHSWFICQRSLVWISAL